MGMNVETLALVSDTETQGSTMNDHKHIPDDLIITCILPRVAAKSLIRFKSVSKLWLSTISSPSFAKSQLKISRSRPQFFLRIIPRCNESSSAASMTLQAYRGKLSLRFDDYEYYLLSEEDAGLMVQPLPAFPILSDNDGYNILGCCNGLICYSTFSKHYNSVYFHIWNPTVRECLHIRSPYLLSSFGGYLDLAAHGFRYVSSIDDYKVAILYKRNCENVIRICVYSVGDGVWTHIRSPFLESWRSLLESCSNCRSRVSFEPVSIDDSLYWLFCCGRGWDGHSPQGHIVRLDLVSEQAEVYPVATTMNLQSQLELFFLDGRLSLSYVCDETKKHQVWTLKRNAHDLSCTTNWEKVWIDADFRDCTLLNISEDGYCLVNRISSGYHQLELYDRYRQVARKQSAGKRIDFKDCIVQIWCYAESLISFPKSIKLLQGSSSTLLFDQCT